MGKALCECPFALHRKQPEKYKQNIDVSPWKNFCGCQWKGGLGHTTEGLPIIAVRNTAERSFSKLRLIKTFHRQTITDERLTNPAMMSIESEAANLLDMTELTTTFAL